MFDLLIDGWEPIRTRSYANAREQAQWIANKDRVAVVIAEISGAFESEIVTPC